MHYYEIWFYFYGEDDKRTDLNKEYTFYLKTGRLIQNDEEMIDELKRNFPLTAEFNIPGINCIPDEDYKFMSKWFEISADEFEEGCGLMP